MKARNYNNKYFWNIGVSLEIEHKFNWQYLRIHLKTVILKEKKHLKQEIEVHIKVVINKYIYS